MSTTIRRRAPFAVYSAAVTMNCLSQSAFVKTFAARDRSWRRYLGLGRKPGFDFGSRRARATARNAAGLPFGEAAQLPPVIDHDPSHHGANEQDRKPVGDHDENSM